MPFILPYEDDKELLRQSILYKISDSTVLSLVGNIVASALDDLFADISSLCATRDRFVARNKQVIKEYLKLAETTEKKAKAEFRKKHKRVIDLYKSYEQTVDVAVKEKFASIRYFKSNWFKLTELDLDYLKEKYCETHGISKEREFDYGYRLTLELD